MTPSSPLPPSRLFTLLLLFGHGLTSQAMAAPQSEPLHFGPARAFSHEKLIEQAADRVRQPYTPPPVIEPEVVRQIDYEAWGNIRYRPGSALFAEGPGLFPVTFFHVGQYFQNPVRIHRVNQGKSREILYDPRYFEMPPDSIARRLPPNTGFAGFRLQEARSREDWRTQDWIAFLGASYFRAIGALNQYGLSARGIDINSAEPIPEEFPAFTEFYVEESSEPAAPVRIHALLDGPSVVGAYRFLIERTEGVVQEVDATLFMRQPVSRLGLASLTSMYWFSETAKQRMEDWRPEVHDSDGLAIWTGHGERLWRPLINPPFASASSFSDRNPKGFGLLQRDRNLENYLDGVNYERRPSLWVEPLGDWGEGAVELLELPTDDEIHDNIVAHWRPAATLKAGDRIQLRYRLHWLGEEPYPAKVARCVATRIGRGGQPGKPRPQGVYKFSVEFAGPALDPLWGDTVKAEPVVTASSGTISGAFMEPIPGTRRWRALFDLTPVDDQPVELRLYIRGNGDALTETWLYQFRKPRE